MNGIGHDVGCGEMAWFIDEHGRLLSASELRDALLSDLAPGDLSTYVVANMGYVAIEERRGTVWLRLRPRAVSQVTLAAVLFWLGDRASERVVVSHYDRRWHHEVMGPTSAALARVAELVIDPLEIRGGDFRRRRCRIVTGLLVSLLQRWQDDPAAPFSQPCRDFLQDRLSGRYMVLKCTRWSRRLEICDVGRGFVSFDNDWLSKAVGRRFEDQPDHLFGRWAAKAYYEAISTEQVIIDDVDALIDWPGRSKARRQYQRIILPFRQPSGDHLLLCSSLLDRSIDLRSAAA
jgi:hypothetical protein